MKYTTVRVSNIITQIAEETDIIGYTKGVMEVFLPDTNDMTDKQVSLWIKQNNKRMRAICKFLNDNQL